MVEILSLIFLPIKSNGLTEATAILMRVSWIPHISSSTSSTTMRDNYSTSNIISPSDLKLLSHLLHSRPLLRILLLWVEWFMSSITQLSVLELTTKCSPLTLWVTTMLARGLPTTCHNLRLVHTTSPQNTTRHGKTQALPLHFPMMDLQTSNLLPVTPHLLWQ